MPYISDRFTREEIDHVLSTLTAHITSKGELNYAICELVGRLILRGKISYTTMSEWIDGVHDAEDELRRRLLHPYENTKIIENGDLDSFSEIHKRIQNGQS